MLLFGKRNPANMNKMYLPFYQFYYKALDMPRICNFPFDSVVKKTKCLQYDVVLDTELEFVWL